MADITIASLRGLILSAADLRIMNPEWTDAMIEDYLTIIENLITIAGFINEKANKQPDAIEDNIIVFDDDGDLKDSGESIDTLRARSYFYGRVY